MLLTCLACGDSKEATKAAGEAATKNWWDEERGQICKKCLDSLNATVMETS